MTHRAQTSRAGFTLIELLVVAAILAAVAFIASGTFKGATERADDGIVLTEMKQIAGALRQFKQDTGYYPKTGPFDLDSNGGEVVMASVLSAEWFYSPANLYQLLTTESPLAGTDHLLEEWNPDTQRGWRGPYLTGYDEGLLYLGDDINGDFALGDPTGAPQEGTLIHDVPAVADPFEQWSETGLGWLAWNNDIEDYEPLEKWGNPYLVFDLSVTGMPWVVSMGKDGELDAVSVDDHENDDIKLLVP